MGWNTGALPLARPTPPRSEVPSDPTRHLFGAKVAPDLLTLAEPALRRLGWLEGGHINAASLKFGNERSGNDEPNETPFLERRIGYGTGRGLLIAIVVILVVTAAWIIWGRSLQPL